MVCNYNNGKIYKIYSPDRPDILPYYGSTTHTLAWRWSVHKATYKRSLITSVGASTSAKHIEHGGRAVIELVHVFPCASRKELLREERRVILANPHCNHRLPGPTRAEILANGASRSRDKYYKERELCACGRFVSRKQKADHDARPYHITRTLPRDSLTTEQRQAQLSKAAEYLTKYLDGI